MKKILFLLVAFFACDIHAFTIKNTIGHAVYYKISVVSQSGVGLGNPGMNILPSFASKTFVLPPQLTPNDVINIEFFYTDSQGQCRWVEPAHFVQNILQWPNQTLELWDKSYYINPNGNIPVSAPHNSVVLGRMPLGMCSGAYKEVDPQATVMPANKP